MTYMWCSIYTDMHKLIQLTNIMTIALFLFLSTLCHLSFAFTDCPYQLAPLVGSTVTYEYNPFGSQAVTFSICGTIDNMACGQQCINSTKGCCGACQSWIDKTVPKSACLGTVYQSSMIYPNSTIVLKYVHGDIINSGERNILLTFQCGTEKFQPVMFEQPCNDCGPPYIYRLTVESIYACPCIWNTTCKSCASPSCLWCLDNDMCQDPQIFPCHNYIKNPLYCPDTCHAHTKCDECTNAQCAWCLGTNVCVELADTNRCTNGSVRDPNFCQ